MMKFDIVGNGLIVACTSTGLLTLGKIVGDKYQSIASKS